MHWPTFWADKRGYEYALLNLVAALGLGLTGPGAYSLDAALRIGLPEPITLMVTVGLAVIGAVVALVTRMPGPAPVPAVAEG